MCARFLCRLSHGELLKFYLFRNCTSQPHKTFPKGTELSETGPFLLARFCEADWLNSETKKLPARRPPFPCLTDGINGSSLCLLFSLCPAPTVVRCKFAQPLSGESRIFSYSTTALWKSGLGLNNQQPSPEYAESPKINADKEERRVREALYSSG